MGPLAEVFCGVVADASQVDAEALELVLATLVRVGRAACPGIKLLPADFIAHVAERLGESGDLLARLGELHAADLYLAYACARGDPRAIQLLDERELAQVAQFVARIDRAPAFVDQVKQKMREKLLVAPGDGGRSKIHDYTGRGPLGGWLRTAAVRTALNLKRAVKQGAARESPLGPRDEHAAAGNPEVDYLKTFSKREVGEAFRGALDTISSEEREILRLHYLEGRNIDAIGEACGIHRATAARRMARAHARILSETKRLLSERLQSTPAEIDSMMGLVQSQLDVSIHRLLKKTER